MLLFSGVKGVVCFFVCRGGGGGGSGDFSFVVVFVSLGFGFKSCASPMVVVTVKEGVVLGFCLAAWGPGLLQRVWSGV